MSINLFPNTVAATGVSPNLIEVGQGQTVGSVQFEVVTTATVKLQASNDPRVKTAPASAVWSDITAGDSADAMYSINARYKYIRGNVTAWTAGDVNAWVCLVNEA